MTFSLIIPCYNEARNLPLLLERCQKLKEAEGVEVVLVDNGSTDDTPAVLASLLPRYPHCRSVRVEVNQGYGFGILSGLRAAKGDILGWTHADMQTDPVDALTGLRIFQDGDDGLFVKGRRFGRPLTDVFFTVGMSVLETLLLRKPLWDINAQPNMFPRRFFESWQNPPHDFSLDLFVYYQARRAGLKVRRFPVHFGPRAYGASHWNSGWMARIKFIKRTLAFSLDLWRRTRGTGL